MNHVEQWRPIPSFDRYEVSDLGRVRSWAVRGNTRRRYADEPKLLTIGKFHEYGYPMLSLRNDDGKVKTCALHNLVLLAWVGPLPDGEVGRHLDGNPLNNIPRNLIYGTRQQNAEDRLRHGTHVCGTAIPSAVLNEDSVRAIIASDESLAALGRTYGVNKETVRQIRIGNHWKHISRLQRTSL